MSNCKAVFPNECNLMYIDQYGPPNPIITKQKNIFTNGYKKKFIGWISLFTCAHGSATWWCLATTTVIVAATTRSSLECMIPMKKVREPRTLYIYAYIFIGIKPQPCQAVSLASWFLFRSGTNERPSECGLISRTEVLLLLDCSIQHIAPLWSCYGRLEGRMHVLAPCCARWDMESPARITLYHRLLTSEWKDSFQ